MAGLLDQNGNLVLTSQNIVALAEALNLKEASHRNVGPGSNEVAAGNHTHDAVYAGINDIINHKADPNAHPNYHPRTAIEYIENSLTGTIDVVSNKHYGVLAAVSVRLPASPQIGDWLILTLAQETTILRNGKLIQSLNEDLTVHAPVTPNTSTTVMLRFLGSRFGWTLI